MKRYIVGITICLFCLSGLAVADRYDLEQVFLGGSNHPDSSALTLGTGDDLSCEHDGTDTICTSSTGDLVFDNTDVNDQIKVRLGTDTSATGFEIHNNSDATIFSVDGAGTMGAVTLDGTDALTFTVNEDGAAGTDEDPGLLLEGGDGGTSLITTHLLQDSGGDFVQLYMDDGGTNVKTDLYLGASGETLDLDPTIRFTGSSDTIAIVYDSSDDDLDLGTDGTAVSTVVNLDAEAGLDVSGGAQTFTGSNLDLDPTGTYDLAMDANQAVGLTLSPTYASALVVDDGTDNFFVIDTNTPDISLGNAVQNPTLQVLGSGQVSISGNVDATNGLDVTTAALTADADLSVTGGDITMTGEDIDLEPTGTYELEMDNGQAWTTEIDGAASNFSLAADGAGDDLTIEVTGAQDSSLVLQSAGTGADALQLRASAGGLDIAAASGSALDINDGVLNFNLTSGSISETGLVGVDLTGTGDIDITGGTSAQFGDDVATLDFDGAGALSETGMTSVSVTPSGAITLTAGATSTWSSTAALNLTTGTSANWQLSGNDAGNLTLAVDSVNGGGGQGILSLAADDLVNVGDVGNPSIDFPGSGNVTFTGNPAINLGSGGVTAGGNIAMGTNKVTGLGAASANGDAVRYEQLTDQLNGSVAIAQLVQSGQPIAHDTVTIGADVYEFDGVGGNINVTIGVDAETTLASLCTAINSSGTEFVRCDKPGVTTLRIQSADAAGGTAQNADPDISLTEAATNYTWLAGNVNMNTLSGRATSLQQSARATMDVTAALVAGSGAVFFQFEFTPADFMIQVRNSSGVLKQNVSDQWTITGNAIQWTSAGAVHVANGDTVSIQAWE